MHLGVSEHFLLFQKVVLDRSISNRHVFQILLRCFQQSLPCAVGFTHWELREGKWLWQCATQTQPLISKVYIKTYLMTLSGNSGCSPLHHGSEMVQNTTK